MGLGFQSSFKVFFWLALKYFNFWVYLSRLKRLTFLGGVQKSAQYTYLFRVPYHGLLYISP